jgi:hypothetical protein
MEVVVYVLRNPKDRRGEFSPSPSPSLAKNFLFWQDLLAEAV